MELTGKRRGSAVCLVALALLLLAAQPSLAAPSLVTYIRDIVFGDPLNLRSQEHPFDPEAGARWRREFVRLNGPLGSQLIDRQGAGEAPAAAPQ